MKRYLQQLLADINLAQENISEPWWYFIDGGEEDDLFSLRVDDVQHGPAKNLEELTGLQKVELPPADKMDDLQLHQLLNALKEMLSAFNCHVVFQRTGVPERIQYGIIRSRFQQDVPQMRNADNFFTFCDPGQKRSDCELGEYCECNFIENMLSHYQELENEVDEQDELDFHDQYLRRKYGQDWDHDYRHHDWDPLEDDFLDEDDSEDWWDDEEEEW